jgi:hypothetical protein
MRVRVPFHSPLPRGLDEFQVALKNKRNKCRAPIGLRGHLSSTHQSQLLFSHLGSLDSAPDITSTVDDLPVILYKVYMTRSIYQLTLAISQWRHCFGEGL